MNFFPYAYVYYYIEWERKRRLLFKKKIAFKQKKKSDCVFGVSLVYRFNKARKKKIIKKFHNLEKKITAVQQLNNVKAVRII